VKRKYGKYPPFPFPRKEACQHSFFGEGVPLNHYPSAPSITETDFGYTGQRDYSDDFGLMVWEDRFYNNSNITRV